MPAVGAPRTDGVGAELSRARAEFLRDELEAALSRVDRVLATSGDDRDALRLQHELRTRLRWMSGALAPLLRLHERDATQAEVRRLLAHCRQQSDCDGALALLERLAPRTHDLDLEKMEILVECRRYAEASRWARVLAARADLGVADALKLGALSLRAGDEGVATRLATAAVLAEGESSVALVFAGTLALWSGDLAHADALATRAHESDPHAGSPRKLNGQVALVRGRVAEAASHFDAATHAPGADHETWILHAEGRRLLGDLDGARASFERARAVDAGYSLALEINEILSVRWRAVGRIPGAARRIRHLDLLDGLGALGVVERSWRARRSPAVLSASVEWTLEEALARLSGNRSALLTRVGPAGTFRCVRPGPGVRAACVHARSLLAHGGFAAAIAAYDSLLADFGHAPLVYTHRGELLLWEGRYAEAAADFETALRLERRTRWAWVGLGAAWLFRGHPRRALATFARGHLHARPGLLTHVYRGEAWRMLGYRRPALAAFERARELHPGRASAHLNLAIHYASKRQPERMTESVVAFERLAPGLFRAMLRETSTRAGDLSADTHAAARVFAHGLRMMRGNRSSGYVSWFSADGVAHAERGAANHL